MTRLSSEPQENEVQAEGFSEKKNVKEMKKIINKKKRNFIEWANTVKKEIGVETVKYFN